MKTPTSGEVEQVEGFAVYIGLVLFGLSEGKAQEKPSTSLHIIRSCLKGTSGPKYEATVSESSRKLKHSSSKTVGQLHKPAQLPDHFEVYLDS